MKKQSRGGRPSSERSQEHRGQDDIEREYGETGATRKSALGGSGQAGESGEGGTFGASRGDAYIDRDLEEVEREDDSLLAGGREDVESEPQSQPSGKSASSGKSSTSGGKSAPSGGHGRKG